MLSAAAIAGIACRKVGLDLARGSFFGSKGIEWFHVLQKNLSANILSGLEHIVRTTHIAPIIFIGSKGEDLLSAGSETEIRRDYGKRSFLCHHPKQAGRNYVDAAESQRLH